MEGIYPEYSKERTEMIYDKRHFVIPILKSSRKGVVIVSQDPDWKHEVSEDENHCKWRVETTPFGVFRCNLTKKAPVMFELKTKKIPGEYLFGSLKKSMPYRFSLTKKRKYMRFMSRFSGQRLAQSYLKETGRWRRIKYWLWMFTAMLLCPLFFQLLMIRMKKGSGYIWF